MDFLVAADGSDEATSALEYAIDVATAMGASITIAHAVDPTAYETGGSEPITEPTDADDRIVVESETAAEERGLTVLEEAAARAEALGHDVETELLYGDPATEITEYAEANGVDAIFVGHRGRSERAGLMLGSVAKDLVERATTPVTVVR